MKYNFIKSYKKEFKISRMCHVLGVNRSGYYSWINRPASKRKLSNLNLLKDIKRIHESSNKIYGSPKIFKELRKEGKIIGHNRVATLMKKHNIKSKVKKKYRKHLSIVDDNKSSLNILNRDFNPTEPNKSWCTDITYISTKRGWVYLCVFIDLYSKKIVGWSVDSHMKTSLILKALKMAIIRRKPKKDLIIHSDRGSQYGSNEFKK